VWGTRAVPAGRRYTVACTLLFRYGFTVVPPAWPPSGFLPGPTPETGEWHLRGEWGNSRDYVDARELIDTNLSYPAPAKGYSYQVHLTTTVGQGRNVAFHMDLSKQPSLRYHWHDYLDGEHNRPHHPMSPVTLTWFLEVALSLFATPSMSVTDLFTLYPPERATPDSW
jgi:hypothetical protein